MDAGGRNCVTSLVSKGGFVKSTAVVGMAVWLQHWYWYPLMHFFSLAATPTAMVGLTEDMRIPKGPATETSGFEALCSCKPSWFAYVPPLPEEKKDVAAAIKKIDLSAASKAKAKKDAQTKKETPAANGGSAVTGGAAPMEEDSASAAAPASTPSASPSEEKKEEDKKEPGWYRLTNPCRVSQAQVKYVSFPSALPSAGESKEGGSQVRYRPLRRDALKISNVVMLKDTKQGVYDATITQVLPPGPPAGIAGEEPEPNPPQQFEWDPTEDGYF